MSRAYIRNNEIVENMMDLSLKIEIPYDAAVHSPKVSLIYTMGEETRVIPVLVRSYYPNMDGKTCTIIAGYRYNIDELFISPIKDEPVLMEVDVLYGTKHLRDIPFEIDTKVLTFDTPYTLTAENNEIVIKRVEPYEEPRKNYLLIIFKFIFGGIYNFIIRIFGLLLIPYLLIDTIAVLLDFKRGWVTKHDRTLYRFVIDNCRIGFSTITHESIGRKHIKRNWVHFCMFICKNKKVVNNRITFLSNRRGELSGNPAEIYNVLKDDETLDIRMLLNDKPMHAMSFINLYKFAKYYSTSKVVIVDDYYELTSMVEKKPEVKLVQVWHACGAFKTFGFSRLGKPGGPKQTSNNHRMYDRAIVSSKRISRFYAEGFGIPIENVVATGVPRTDMFFSKEIAKEMKAKFYEEYPEWKSKKIILFAPTFRGNGRLTGYYPMEYFNIQEICDAIGPEYGIIIKMHPFVNNVIEIPEGYEDRVIDLSENSELNDLLFVTDILITDYSSAIFEASLLNIPMIMYAYDLSEYIATRDFYYEYEPMIPGKLTMNQNELVDAIINKDFEKERIKSFKNKFFDDLDGKSSERVANMIKELLV